MQSSQDSSSKSRKRRIAECELCGKKFVEEDGRKFGDFLLCPSCARYIDRLDNSTAENNREGGSVTLAYIDLFTAIRQQAIEDNKLDDFESYWIKPPKWKALWNALQDEEKKSHETQNVAMSTIL